MELRLLSAEVEDLVDPDDGAIGEALAELPDTSGDKVPRAVLKHGNGSDFIQFFAMEEMGEKWKERRNTPCHLQYFRYAKHGERTHFFSEDADFEQVIKIFKLYGKRGQEWKREVNWEPYIPKRRIWEMFKGLGCGIPLILLALGLLFGGRLGQGGMDTFMPLGFLCLGGYFIWSGVISRPTIGLPWTSAGSTFSAGGGCSSGGGGDGGGGGGDGGGCGGGGE